MDGAEEGCVVVRLVDLNGNALVKRLEGIRCSGKAMLMLSLLRTALGMQEPAGIQSVLRKQLKKASHDGCREWRDGQAH
jgi:hypothetical protein